MRPAFRLLQLVLLVTVVFAHQAAPVSADPFQCGPSNCTCDDDTNSCECYFINDCPGGPELCEYLCDECFGFNYGSSYCNETTYGCECGD